MFTVTTKSIAAPAGNAWATARFDSKHRLRYAQHRRAGARRCEGAKHASGKISSLSRCWPRAKRLQVVESLQKNTVVYGEFASGGVYTQSDPIGLDGGWNRYGYANGSPLMFIDPTGELSLADIWHGTSNFAGGFGSYYRGMYRAGDHLYRRSGFEGDCEQQRAIEDEALLGGALYSLSDPRVARPAVQNAATWASNNKARVTGRFGAGLLTGAAMSRVGPFGFAGGMSMGAAAAMGDALHGVQNGADNPEQVLRNIFGENAPAVPSNAPNRTVCGCRR